MIKFSRLDQRQNCHADQRAQVINSVINSPQEDFEVLYHTKQCNNMNIHDPERVYMIIMVTNKL